MKQRWIADIESFTDSIPYGQVDITVERVNRHTVQVSTVGVETLRYVNNEDCIKDIVEFIGSLVDEEHTGEVQFGVVMKQGQMKLLTIKNTKKTNYT